MKAGRKTRDDRYKKTPKCIFRWHTVSENLISELTRGSKSIIPILPHPLTQNLHDDIVLDFLEAEYGLQFTLIK